MAARIPTTANKMTLRDVLPGAQPQTTLTISGGAVVPIRGAHVIAAESGTADDLDTLTLTNLRAGDVVELTADTGDTITITNGVGNITTDTAASLVITGGQTARFKVNAAGGSVVASLISGKPYTDAAIAALLDSAPGALDTLNELAAALGDDASFATTVANSLATTARSIAAAGVGGTGDAIALTLASGPTLADGLTLSFIPGAANTGAVTVNYNAGGALALVDGDDEALAADALKTTAPVIIRYTSSGTKWRLISVGAAASGLAVNDVTALRALNGAALDDGSIVFLRAHTNAGDGGGGNFRFYKTQAGTDDGGITFRAADYVSEGNVGVFVRADAEGHNTINVKWFGAQGDAVRLFLSTGAITSGSAAFHDDNGIFTSADVGKTIAVFGAGAFGVYSALVTTIAAVASATDITLTDTATATTAAADYVYGTDDTAALQAALNTSSTDVYIPPSDYLITSTLTSSVNSRVHRGDARTNPEFLAGSKFYWMHDGPCFTIRQAGNVVTGLAFNGFRTTNGMAILAERTANTDDIDVYINWSSFNQLVKTVRVVGRACYFENNEVGPCDIGVEVEFPTVGVIATGDHHDVPDGHRAARITRNRFHSASEAAVKSVGTNRQYFRNAEISHNTLDVGDCLFLGGINSSLIAFNSVFLSGESTGVIRIESGGDNVTLMGNKFEGQSSDAADTPAIMVYIDDDVDGIVNGFQMVGESYKYCDGNMIETVAEMQNLVISGCAFNDAGRVTAGSAIINMGDAWTGATITGNSFTRGSATYYVNTNGATLTNVLAIANEIDTSGFAFFEGTPINGGGNAVQEGAQLVIGALSAIRPFATESSSSVQWEMNRTGSSSSVGFRATNTAGFIDTFILPTGSQLGAFAMGSDGGVDLGTSSLKYKDIYQSGTHYFGAVAVFAGAGSPESVVTAVAGSLYMRTDGGAGTTLYVKESGAGNTGWIAK